MATSGKPTHGALPPLLAAVVMVALLAGVCTAIETIPTPSDPIVESPPLSVRNVTVINLLEVPINFTLSTNIDGAVQFYTSAEIEPKDSKQLQVNIASTAGVGAKATVIVGIEVYAIPVNVTQRVFVQSGTVTIKVSFPCHDNERGLLISESSDLTDLEDVENCTGPPISSS